MGNTASTPATTNAYDADFANGTSMAQAENTQQAVVPAESIASRRSKRGFKGSTLQPMRTGGPKYVFQDEPANHPEIPFSSQTALTENSPRVSTSGKGAGYRPGTPMTRNPRNAV